jgi:hypothetical protein
MLALVARAVYLTSKSLYKKHQLQLVQPKIIVTHSRKSLSTVCPCLVLRFHAGHRKERLINCVWLCRVSSCLLDISLSTISTWRIFSYTPVDARYLPKGGAVVEAIAGDRLPEKDK